MCKHWAYSEIMLTLNLPLYWNIENSLAFKETHFFSSISYKRENLLNCKICLQYLKKANKQKIIKFSSFGPNISHKKYIYKTFFVVIYIIDINKFLYPPPNHPCPPLPPWLSSLEGSFIYVFF